MGGVLCRESCDSFAEEVVKSKQENETCEPWYSNVEVDWNGCRKFDQLPPPGQHPRLFFSKEDIPRIHARFTHSEMAPQLKVILNQIRKGFLIYYEKVTTLPEEEIEAPTEKETIDEFFHPDEPRNACILGSYVYGVMYDDSDLVDKTKQVALFYAKVILRAREIACEESIRDKWYKVWHSNEWNLNIAWLFGGHCYAFLYDIMFNDISHEDQEVMRKAITAAISGRRSWGMGWSTRRIQSNWAPYHGDIFALSAVVEGEKGFDREVFALYSDLMVHYMDYAFYNSGHPLEDAYALNVGFREGSLCFLIMARRGHNLFNHPHFKKIWTDWLPYALEPNNSGQIYGGSSGSEWPYPTSAIIAKYMFPKDRRIDHFYRHFMCEEGKKYSRLLKVQSRIAVLAFAIPALCENLEEPEKPDELGLPLNFVCRDRGKVIMRSDWSENAMWFTLDARPDGFLIGHDACSRGAFVLNADGRSWGLCPEWKYFDESTDYSIPCIDGVGQRNKAPFVKLLSIEDGDTGSTFASADITYAYNWKWTTWAKEGLDMSEKGWEPEPNDPRDFGYNVWWSPTKLFDEPNVAFLGLHQWRKRFAEVESVFRSALLVRAEKPYVIIADDVQKDENVHEYTWAMTTPSDVALESFDGRDAILKALDESDRRLLVRSLSDSDEPLDCRFRMIAKLNKSSRKDVLVGQVTFSCESSIANFRMLLFSLPTKDTEAPETEWLEDGAVLRVTNNENDDAQEIAFMDGCNGETKMKLVEAPSDE